MSSERTIGERLAVIEAITLRIETKLDRMDTRVSRLEKLGATITGIFTSVAFYFHYGLKK